MFVDILIGKVTHYYDKIGVAIVEVVNQTLKVGDTIKFSGHDIEFNQKVTSMQQEYEKILEAKPGTIIGIQAEQRVKENDQVFLVN